MQRGRQEAEPPGRLAAREQKMAVQTPCSEDIERAVDEEAGALLTGTRLLEGLTSDLGPHLARPVTVPTVAHLRPGFFLACRMR